MKFSCTLLTLVLIGASQALKCKKCKDLSCDNLENETCPIKAGAGMAACLTHIYKGSDKAQVIEKKCVSVSKEGEYECDSSLDNLLCRVCTQDFCNEKNSGSLVGQCTYYLIIASSLFVLQCI